MNPSSCKCPSSTDLRELLEGNIADSDQAEVVSHLDQCGSCQQSLEALANVDSSLAITLRDQAAYQTPEPNSAYWPALKNVEEALTLAAPPPRSSTDISLSFLNPPTDGSYLGSLGNFNVVRVVGRGGMGVVLQATDTHLQRDVALKVLDPELSRDEEAGTRFCREARAAASISHENVVAVHQVQRDETTDMPFLVMELISGESLEKKLERDGRLSLREIVSIGMQTASGLAAAHETGLIHRDIKPGNILLVNSGVLSGRVKTGLSSESHESPAITPSAAPLSAPVRVKLTDFGLARATEDVRLTRTGMVAGTPLYMSPEQATGEELDARSDLFSLGVVLYELAAGEPPFNGKTPLAVLKRLTEEQPVPLRERNPDLPEWFVHIVDRLLAKRPEDRFQTARQVADTLEHFWVLLKSTETPVCPKKKAANLWKAVTLGAAAGLLTLLLGAAAVFILWPREDKMPPPLHLFKGNARPLWSLAISKDGKNLAMGTDDGSVKFWDIDAEKVVWSFPAHKGTIWALALAPKYLATSSDDGPAKIWDLSTQKELFAIEDSIGTRSLAFDPEGKRLLMGGRKGTVKVWDVANNKEVVRTAGHNGALVGAVAFAPDGKTMASASGDMTIKLWNAATGGETLKLQGHQSGVYSIAYSPDSRYLVSGSWDRTIRLWDLASGTSIRTLTTPTQDVWSVDFNAQGTLFAGTGEDQMVRVFDFASKKQVAAFRGSSGAILNVRFVPERGLIVAAGKDGDARVWRLADLHIGN